MLINNPTPCPTLFCKGYKGYLKRRSTLLLYWINIEGALNGGIKYGYHPRAAARMVSRSMPQSLCSWGTGPWVTNWSGRPSTVTGGTSTAE